MPINADIYYKIAEEEYNKAETIEQKIKALKEMISTAPSHKGAESLRKNLKKRLAKLEYTKEKASKKTGKYGISIKKEGSARVCIVGTTNSGKSTLLKELTKANVKIAPYEFTTKKPEIGIMDYYGIKIQIIEIPAILENFYETHNHRTYLSIINDSDLVILMFNNAEEKSLLDKELNEVKITTLIFDKIEGFKDKIWKNLNLIKVYTKEPGKEKSFPPLALKKESTVRDLALKVHKDFVKKFKYAIINGKSAKFKNQIIGLEHKLEDDDIVEFHLES